MLKIILESCRSMRAELEVVQRPSSFKTRLPGLRVIDRNFSQSLRAHYEMDDSCISREFRVVYHRFTDVVADTVGPNYSRACEGVFIPLHISLRLNLVAMSRQRGTPKRANSGRAKSQRGSSVPIPTDYELHILARVRVLVEAWENKVLNRKLSTGEEGGNINHYWMLKNMLYNLAEDMLSNWAEARMVIHTMKRKVVEIDA